MSSFCVKVSADYCYFIWPVICFLPALCVCALCALRWKGGSIHCHCQSVCDERKTNKFYGSQWRIECPCVCVCVNREKIQQKMFIVYCICVRWTFYHSSLELCTSPQNTLHACMCEQVEFTAHTYTHTHMDILARYYVSARDLFLSNWSSILPNTHNLSIANVIRWFDFTRTLPWQCPSYDIYLHVQCLCFIANPAIHMASHGTFQFSPIIWLQLLWAELTRMNFSSFSRKY